MIRILFRLLRPRLALVNGVTALAGYLLFPAGPELARMVAVMGGVALLAAGGSAFNQLQECGLDRLMVRTRLRPLPAGDLTPAAVIVIAGFCSLAGFLLLAAVGGFLSALLGAAALIWYLAVYTPLKRRSCYALAAGAVCGALTPVIGWCAAGGEPLDFRAILLAGLLYLWQIPHFWLLQRRYADDYRRAGLPLVAVGKEGGVASGLFWLWLTALFAGTMLLPAFGVIPSRAAFWYVAFPVPLALLFLFRSERALFSYLNLFPLLVTLTLI
jgi:heme o synthase